MGRNGTIALRAGVLVLRGMLGSCCLRLLLPNKLLGQVWVAKRVVIVGVSKIPCQGGLLRLGGGRWRLRAPVAPLLLVPRSPVAVSSPAAAAGRFAMPMSAAGTRVPAVEAVRIIVLVAGIPSTTTA
jgi:hypothetical protein